MVHGGILAVQLRAVGILNRVDPLVSASNRNFARKEGGGGGGGGGNIIHVSEEASSEEAVYRVYSNYR